MIKKTILFFIALLLCIPIKAYSQDASQYLILNDIGTYRPSPGFEFMGKIVGRGPTTFQGGDEASGYYTAYKITYAGSSGNPHPTAEVRVHQNTQWLLHEVEDGYRDPDVLEASLTEGTVLRIIDGNRVFNWGAGSYTWISSTNIVVRIEYTDLTGAKPEPIEVVRAYLRKFPSAITLTDAELKSRSHSEKWIKDEMERRLWLCDKWFMAFQLGKVQQGDMLEAMVKNMNVFLDYRQKYYGIDATEEKKALSDYLYRNDGTAIRNKLTEYKTWWAANKDKAISI